MLKIIADRAMYGDAIDMLVVDHRGVIRSVGKPVEFERLSEGHIAREPTLRLGMAQAQELMDNLWQCGLRPTEMRDRGGALEATQHHLEDMRALLYSRLDLPRDLLERK